MMLKRLISTAAGRLGYTIVPNWQIETFTNVRHMRRLFDFLTIDLVVDVGANVGQFRDLVRDQVGYTGRILSFEPVPHLARALAMRAEADPLWTVEPRALGATPGSANFNIMSDTQFSSFLVPRHDEVALFTHSNTIQESIAVEVTSLDAVLMPWIKNDKPRGIYLKLDTQGFDLEVLKGAEVSLSFIPALQTEASVRPIYDGAPSFQETVDFATARGFVVSGFFPNNEGHFPQLIEFDCYMIRRDRVN